MQKCERFGCQQMFDPSKNIVTEFDEGPCWYHPGSALFHEGLKGWTCCKKKVIEFDDFLKIPGCTRGLHSIEESDKSIAPSPNAPKDSKISLISTTQGEEVIRSTPQPQPIKPSPSKPAPILKEPVDPPDAKIEIGTKCKHDCCEATFRGDESRTEDCLFHNGFPLFHEGTKGWTCCSKKVLEFEEFLKIEGCTTGKHRFLDIKTEESKKVQCRFDWYQNAQNVILSVYAKKVNKSKSEIKIEREKLRIRLIFDDDSIYEQDFSLSQPVKPEKSKFEILSTKVEMTLSKANGAKWNNIE